MFEMPKGLLVRFLAVCGGCVLVPALLSLVSLSSDGAAAVELFYLFTSMGYLFYFILKHEDEIPTRSGRG
jgi:uncharacterized membrane protein YfcA